MDLYHIWCDLAPGMKDMVFVDAVRAYLGRLQAENAIAGFRLTRCKLGLSPPEMGEFHIIVETTDLAQLDRAFKAAACRAEPVEGLHHAVNHMVRNARFALYRDFPDPVRVTGQERF